MDEFYVLRQPLKGEAVTDYYVTSPLSEIQINVSRCGHIRGSNVPLAPIQVELKLLGKYWGDIAFGDADYLLVTGHFKQLYFANHLTGLGDFFPVQMSRVIPKRRAQNVPEYFLASVHTSRAALDDLASERIKEDLVTCDECRRGRIRAISRIVLEKGSWSGEDIFHARGATTEILTSKRFEQFCIENQLRGFLLVPALQYSFDFYNGSGGGFKLTPDGRWESVPRVDYPADWPTPAWQFEKWPPRGESYWPDTVKDKRR